ncbi:plasmid pRiA4b ORF-3 family protein [Miniimonas arenae]|uniref:Plasmid pRiA4b ORF-3 family protein n=1 Tax=Miniimonas arenae TaxID=676201 RepID=A0A5C5B837_9MICO|nr:plasmid pRiA4b ORF-3 family protein [Miniimonas arenae]TNU72861.1 plasmid pRiA4b ORF-3 family protein [Miniimonas arenae]
METYALRVTLFDVEPPVWRELRVPAGLPLTDLHYALQAAMGWDDAHLYTFGRGERTWRDAHPDLPLEEDGATDVEDGVVADVLERGGEPATYLYDYGDRWEHELTLVALTPDGEPRAVSVPHLDAGEGACPPEDSGGAHGYERLVADGVFDGVDALDPFSLDGAARRVRLQAAPEPPLRPAVAAVLRQAPWRGPGSMFEQVRVAAELVDRSLDTRDCIDLTVHLRWFLAYLGPGGVPLTAAGYLKPADVVALAEELELSREWIGKMTREDSTPPIGQFRELVRRLGLARAFRGRMVCTKLGDRLVNDPVGMVELLVERLPWGDDEPGVAASTLTLIDLAALPHQTPDGNRYQQLNDRDARIQLGMESLRWELVGGDPGLALRSTIRTTVALLTRTDSLRPSDRGFDWHPTPAGRRLVATILGIVPLV